jgi:prophage antirepressor-like protein
MYRVALRMHSREARALLRFVCHEALPALRESGSFKLPPRATKADGTGLIRYLREVIADAKSSAPPPPKTNEADLPW